MLIKFGSIVVDGRGKLGGQVYSKNRGGNYVRNNAVPVNAQTSFQQQNRSQLAQFSQQWSQLTEEQRNGWNGAVGNFAKTNVFGDSKVLSGKNLFTSLNRNLSVSGQANITDAPTPEPLTVPTSIVDLEMVQGGEFEFVVLNTTIGQALVIEATPSVSAGTNFVKNKYRFIANSIISSEDQQVDLATSYPSRFGAIAEGQKIFVRAYTVNSVGQASPKVSLGGFVTAV